MSLSGLISTTTFKEQPAIVRRSGNYKPPLWDAHFIQSLQVIYTEESYGKRINELKEDVRRILEKEAENPLVKLEQINDLSRLGISYHFEDQIKAILNLTYNNNNALWKKDNLYATALHFKLLRQYGFNPVSSEIFNAFKDEKKEFKESLSKDVKGMVCLYEASFYSFRGEPILDEARDFTTKHLKQYLMMTRQGQNVDHDDDNDLMVKLVEHALELPVHWRMKRLEARWFIDMYAEMSHHHHMNSTFLQLAKLDFNVVQSTYQEDLKHVVRWWKTTSLGERLPFARDRIVEIFLWSVGLKFEPQFRYCRKMLTKIGQLVTTMDDIFDVWDINTIDQLPDYMKIFFLATYNVWTDLCKCYMLEANWYHSGYTPSLEEYIKNGWISIAEPLILVNLYCLITNPIKEDDIDCLLQYPTFIRISGIIARLDELKRGDNPKSIQCYMKENGICDEKNGREHIRNLISETWKEMNEARVGESPFSQAFIETAIDFVRTAMMIYQKEQDGVGTNIDHYTKDGIISLFFTSIPI
ncbi:hypothetical protein F8388_001483 [Cannabis sativa]|nr:hypothetical protein F8388_001483 [Cannabis sativa]KAF4366759.1 hypothetical protein G4B88_022052 [Cannabis sativa]